MRNEMLVRIRRRIFPDAQSCGNRRFRGLKVDRQTQAPEIENELIVGDNLGNVSPQFLYLEAHL